MDLDESGVEAFEAEAAVSNAESTPTTFANVTPLTSSTPRTTSVVVENSTPVAPKARKPRGLKKLDKDDDDKDKDKDKEKAEEMPTKVKEEKLSDSKKPPTVSSLLSTIRVRQLRSGGKSPVVSMLKFNHSRNGLTAVTTIICFECDSSCFRQFRQRSPAYGRSLSLPTKSRRAAGSVLEKLPRLAAVSL